MNQLATAVGFASWEAILLLFLIGGGFLLGVLLGRDRIFVLLLGSYISFAIISVVPFTKLFPETFDKEENFVILIVLFLVLIGIIYFLLTRSLLKTAIRRKGRRSLFQIFFLSLFLIGIVVSIFFSFFPKDLISAFSPLVLKIFHASLSRTLWLIIPLIFIGLFRRKRSKYRKET